MMMREMDWDASDDGDVVADNWIPACGGTEVPFFTRNGRKLLYMWNSRTCEHAYYDISRDMFLDYEQAHAEIWGN